MAKSKTETKTKRRTGRPSVYSEAIAAQIFTRMTEGESLRAICRDERMPALSTVYNWLASDKHRDFLERYARAKEERAETLGDEITELADEEPRTFKDANGSIRIDPGWVQWQKLRIDSRKFIASKLKPTSYGDKVDVNLGGQADNPLSVLLQQVSGKTLKPVEDD